MKKTLNWMLFLTVAAALAASPMIAQTPDGETPANEGVCDDLVFATPGLYGLCIAFCEAQDCEPDFGLADPFENCKPSSEKLLRNYDRRKQPGDPDMPCVAAGCPCWTQADLDSLRYPGPDDVTTCRKDYDGFLITNNDDWRITHSESQGYTVVATVEENGAPQRPTCNRYDQRCDPGGTNCVTTVSFFFLDDLDVFAVCEAQVAESGQDRGYACFP